MQKDGPIFLDRVPNGLLKEQFAKDSPAPILQ